jgi:hypothetical protein
MAGRLVFKGSLINRALPTFVLASLLLGAGFTVGLYFGRQSGFVPAALEARDQRLKDALIQDILTSSLRGSSHETEEKINRWEILIETIDRRDNGQVMLAGLLLGWQADNPASTVRGRFWYEATPDPANAAWKFRQVAWQAHARQEPLPWP